jgi:hypothetical protein
MVEGLLSLFHFELDNEATMKLNSQVSEFSDLLNDG